MIRIAGRHGVGVAAQPTGRSDLPHRLVNERGWGWDRYETWLAGSLLALLFDRDGLEQREAAITSDHPAGPESGSDH